MSFFTSDRERRLWFWSLAAIVAIYSTLGFARTVVNALRERNLLGVSFVVVLSLILIALAFSWIKKRPGWREIGVLLGVTFAYMMVGFRIDSWEERTHLIEYGIVAGIIHEALLERVRNGHRVWSPAYLAMIMVALLGLLDEGIQAVLPSRVFDFRDVFFNALAGFMMIAAKLAIAPQQKPGWRIWFLWLMACSIGWGQGVYWGWFSNDEPKTLQHTPSVIMAGFMGLAVGVNMIGALQWLILRKKVIRSGRWLLTNLGATAIVGIVIFGVGVADEDLGWFAGISVFGTVAGALQWIVLRRQAPRAAWWILISTVAWVLGMPAGDAAGPPALGAVYGAITGVAMVWLLRQNQTLVPQNPH